MCIVKICHIDIVYFQLDEHFCSCRSNVGLGRAYSTTINNINSYSKIGGLRLNSKVFLFDIILSVSCCQCHPVDYYHYVCDAASSSASINLVYLNILVALESCIVKRPTFALARLLSQYHNRMLYTKIFIILSAFGKNIVSTSSTATTIVASYTVLHTHRQTDPDTSNTNYVNGFICNSPIDNITYYYVLSICPLLSHHYYFLNIIFERTTKFMYRFKK